jgi:hypothetical protein
VRALDRTRVRDEAREVLASVHAMHEARQARSELLFGRFTRTRRRRVPERRERPRHARADRDHVPESEARRHQADELAIARIGVAMREAHGIRIASLARIRALYERIEAQLQAIEVARGTLGHKRGIRSRPVRLNAHILVASLALLVAGATDAHEETSAFVVAPYLTDPSDASVTVRAITRASIAPTIRVERHAPFTAPRGKVHTIEVTGLTSGTDTPFVFDAGGETFEGVLHPLPDPRADETTLLVLGDTRDGNDLLATFVRRAQARLPDAVLHLGDMVPSGRNDTEWIGFLRAAQPLLRERPMLAVLGNHEIAYSGGRTRFGRYARRFGSRPPSIASYGVGPLEIVILDSNDPDSFATTQRDFLREAAARARARDAQLVVAIHHAPHSAGYHSGLVALHTSGLVREFRRLGVALVLAGHDHIYERGLGDGIPYVITGGAGSPLYLVDRERPHTLAFAPEHHVVSLVATRDTISLTATRLDGTTLERCTLRDRRWLCPEGPRTGVSAFTMWVQPRMIEGAVLLGVLVLASLIGARRGTFRVIARPRQGV